MQTKYQIRQLLTCAGIKPNKNLGQHFLIDLNLMQLLVNAGHISCRDCVLEIGCGTGSLTSLLAERGCEVIAVDIDKTLAGIAGRQLADFDNVRIIISDILESKHTINSEVLKAVKSSRSKCPGRFLLVANLPYNVGTAAIFNLVTGELCIDEMYVTVQKQVAERMCASPGDSLYGILSVVLSATGQAKILRFLKPSVFWPEPGVDSAMVSFVRSKEKFKRIRNMCIFREVVNLFMQHRRKMVKSCVKFAVGRLSKIDNWNEIFESCNIEPTKRPGQISPQDYIAIANELFDLWQKKYRPGIAL